MGKLRDLLREFAVRVVNKADDPIPITGDIDVQLDVATDLFENQKVAQPFTVFDATFENHLQIDLFETILVGLGTRGYSPNEGSVTLNVGTEDGDEAIYVQHGYNQFIDGKEFEINMENTLPQKPNVRCRCGYFDRNNGWYFEVIDQEIWVVGESFVSGAMTNVFRVERANWNVDTLDGNGPSGLTQGVDIDVFTFQRREIITQGTFGKTQFAFDIGGEVVVVHEEVTATVGNTGPAYERASLPVRWEIKNIGVTASPTTMKVQSCSVKIFGEYDVTGFPFSASTGTASRNITTRTAVIAIRVIP